MANRETSDEISTLAAKILNEEPRDGDEHLSYNALLVQAKRLAGSALSQDQTPGKRKKEPAAEPGHPSIRLHKIAENMRGKANAPIPPKENALETIGFLAEALDQYADQIDVIRQEIAAPNAGTTAYEMVAAVETQNVEVTETLIHMVAATVLSVLIDEEGGGRANVSFSPHDMDEMHRRYMLDAKHDGMLTVVRIAPREGVDMARQEPDARTAAPTSFYREDGIDSTEPAQPQAPVHVFDRPLWAARVDGHLFPASDEDQAKAIVGRADVGQIAQVENRYCYHPECPAEHCNQGVNQTALVSDQDGVTTPSGEVTSDVDSPES